MSTISWNIEQTGYREDIKAFVTAEAAAGRLPQNVANVIGDVCDDDTIANPKVKAPNGVRVRCSGTLGGGIGQIGLMKVDPITLTAKPPTPTPGAPAPAAAVPTPATPAAPVSKAA